MNFSKTTLFAAAFLAVSALPIKADLDITQNQTGDVVVTGDAGVAGGGTFTVTTGSHSYTLTGSFLDNASGGSTAGTLVITGGGSLTYAGTLGQGYYTDSYSMSRGETDTSEGSAIYNAWQSIDTFWNSSAYTGQIIVSGGTTLNLEGQLFQYNAFYTPTATTNTDTVYNYDSTQSGIYGASGITLTGGSTISFEQSTLNLSTTRPNLGAQDPSSGYAPTAVLALNFLNNLTSDATSTVVIGSDSGSVNRIFLNTDAGNISTVGVLRGNGRFYTTGAGTVAFIGRSELTSGSNTDEDGNADTTGNTWESGNRLADIILANSTVYVGALPNEDGDVDAVVDNVFANATAVQIGYAAVNNEDPQAVNNVTNAAGIFVPAASNTTVTVFGNQVFNNFQSLWVERTALLSDSNIDAPEPTTQEPVKFSYTSGGSPVYSSGLGTSVTVSSGSVLTINQDYGRDGYYTGTLITSSDDETGSGLVVKTGAGSFAYEGTSFSNDGVAFSRLRIEEGSWISTTNALAETSVTLAGSGALEIVVSGTSSTEMLIQAVDTSSVLSLVRSYELINDLEENAYADYLNGDTELTEDDYRSRGFHESGLDSAAIQFTREQSQFYGSVSVEDGITLILGSSDGYGESIFSSAASINLNGHGTVNASLLQNSVLQINGTQLVRNLIGEAGYSEVNINGSGTLVLTNDSSSSYLGTMGGTGNLVKLGLSQQVVRSGTETNANLSGTVTALAGSLSIEQRNSAGYAGLALGGTASAVVTGDASVGALIGESGTTLSFSGNMTVGRTGTNLASSWDGSYLATSNYSDYSGYFAGTSVAGTLSSLTSSVDNARRYQTGTGSGATYATKTTDETQDYLSDPGGLYEAFTKLYATTGTTQSGVDVFTGILVTNGAELFGTATTVSEWLKNTFTLANVEDYIAGDAQLSADQEAALQELATNISSTNGVSAYLDAEGNLNVEGWNKIVAAAGLEYLKSVYPALEDLQDESFYSFIEFFDVNGEYEFILTARNAALISSTYGLDSSVWFVNGVANYDNFEDSLGIDTLDFAGTLAGSGNLIKTGAETLTLTGVNIYNGSTQITGGELRVDWDAIRATSGVSVDYGALLTIVADADEIAERVVAAGSVADDAVYRGDNGENYGYFFRGESQRLSGRGVVLKLGDGNVDLNRAIYDVAAGASDFTGTFLVGEGALRATVNATARAENANPLAFDIAFSSDAETGETATRRFELVFATPGASAAQELEYTGAIAGGNGTFSFEGGYYTGTDVDGVEYTENNVLVITVAANVDVDAVEVISGTLQLNVAANGLGIPSTAINVDRVLFGSDENAAFAIDLSGNATMTGAALVLLANEGATAPISGTGDFIVSSSAENGASLTMTDADLSGIDSLKVNGTATLSLSSSDAANEVSVTLSELGTESGTTLDLGAGYTLNLAPGADETCVIAGTLSGSGKIVFEGAEASEINHETENGKLVIGSETADSTSQAFGGTISFLSGTIELVAGEDKTVVYSGLTLNADGSDNLPHSRILTKEGAGTVEITSDNNNSIDVGGLEVEVNAGTLAIDAALFVDGSLPTSIYIADDATFAFIDFNDLTETFALGDLNFSGTGTLSFETDPTGNEVYISVDSNIFSDNAGGTTFSGMVNVGAQVVLKLGSNVTEFSGFSGEGRVEVSGDSLTVRVDANANGGQQFSGTLVVPDDFALTVVGDGSLNLAGSTGSDALTQINVGTATQNGGIGVDSAWNGTINAVGAESRVIVEQGAGASGDYAFAGTVVVSDGVSSLVLLRSGSLELGENAISEAFNLKASDGVTDLALNSAEGLPTVTLGNVEGTSLTLTNLGALSSEVFELRANATEDDSAALIFSGAVTTSTYGIASAFDATAAGTNGASVWSKDISGDGGIALSDGATLMLTASSLTYTGATSVESGSTLIYGSEGMTSRTSSLEVASGATVEGGVSLVGESSDVSFADGSTFVFTGEAIRFTGTAEVGSAIGGGNGTLSVKLTKESLGERGRAVSLFEYIGGNTALNQNKITLDKLDFSESEEGVYFYRGSIVGEDTTSVSGRTQIYVATNDLSAVSGVSLHDGLSSNFVGALSAISTPNSEGYLDDSASNPVYYTYNNASGERTGLTELGLLADTIIKTSNSELSGAMNNLSPLSFSAMLAIPQSGFLSDIATVTARMEQRRYDNYSQFIWETNRDWEFFAQMQGSFVESDNDTDTRTYDFNTYGAVAGMDVKLDATAVAGFALAYDYGIADIHNGGGEIRSHDMRFTAFFGKVFAERFYLDTGAQLGFSMFETDRKTVVGGVDGDTTGWHGGVFANVGTLLPMYLSEDEKTGLYLMPFVGATFSYYGVNSFDESGDGLSSETDSFGAGSLRGTIGASLSLKTPCFGYNSRLNFDLAYTHEFLDTDVDIDIEYPGLSAEKMTFESPAFAQDVFSVGPRFVFDLDGDTSIYAGYHFEFSTDSDIVHSANIGFRSRF